MSGASETRHRGIIAWWARNPVAANLLMVLLLVAGVIGYLRIEREVWPTADFNGVSISTAWPGAAPREVEEQIILRIEEALADLDGVDEIQATASEGSASVTVISDRGVDMRDFLDEVKLRVDGVNNLPRDSYPPTVTQIRSQEALMRLAIYGDAPRRVLQRIAREVRDEVSQLPGAGLSDVNAALTEEVTVEVSEEALRRYNISFSEVAQAIRDASLNASAGNVRTELGDVALTSRQLADSPEEFADIVVRQTRSGAQVRVGDLANVDDGFGDANFEAEYDGQLLTMVLVRAGEEVDVVETSQAVRAYLDEKTPQLPPGVTVEVLQDNSEAYQSRIRTMGENAGFGLALVLIVLMLSLRPAVAFWTTIGISVAFAGGLALLPYFGVSFNMLSLFAVLLVTGIVVDDAIVVGENIHNQVESGERAGIDAAIVGAQLVAKPVIFAVLTTMMAFAPWMLLTGPEVQFTRQISLVVIFALGFSLVEALLILPAHLAHLKPQNPRNPVTRAQERVANSIVWFARTMYRPAAHAAIRLRYITVSIFVAVFMVAIGLQTTGWLPFSMMPEMESETVQASIVLPQGTPFSRSITLKERVEAAAEEVNAGYADAYGPERPMITGTVAMAQEGRVQAFIQLASAEQRPANIATSVVSEQIREALGPIPEAEEIMFSATFNEQSSALSWSVSSQDLDQLREAVDALRAQLHTYDAVYDVTDDMQVANEEMRFTLKPGAEAMGVTLAQVTNQVRQAYYGEEVQRLPRDGQDVRVMVRYPEQTRRSLDSLNNLRVRTNDGREMPLFSVADVEFAPSVQRIQRRDRQRAARISAEVSTEQRGDVLRDMEDNFLPAWQDRYPAITLGALGANQQEQEFLSEVLVLQTMMLFAMYALLAVAFRSYFQPLLIMTAIPFALAGAYFGHVLMGMPLALFSYFGIGAAAGVVINDNLVLIDMVNRLRAQGVGALQALIEACTSRFRPILLTTVTTFVGIMPITAETSWQADFLKPMVVSLAFGVVFALFLTLFMVPALYAIGVDMARKARGLWTGEKQPPFGSDWDEEKEFAPPQDQDHIAGPAAPRPAPAE